MVEVGIRELKSRLSYYVQLMQAGETVAVKVRNRVVGFFSRLKPVTTKARSKAKARQDIDRLIEKWKKEGFIVSGGRYRHIPFKAVKMTPGPTASEMIRQMRDEDS